MANGTRKRAWGPTPLAGIWVLTTVLWSVDAAASPDDSLRLVLRVFNYAHTPVSDLHAAEAEATRIFRAAGITLVWTESGPRPDDTPNGGLPLTVVLLDHDMSQRKVAEGALSADVLGKASRATRRTYLLMDRIVAVATDQSRDVTMVLGRVLAHELGHMVLPVDGHSESGIMRARMDLSITPQRFTSQQVRSLRDSICKSLASKR